MSYGKHAMKKANMAQVAQGRSAMSQEVGRQKHTKNFK